MGVGAGGNIGKMMRQQQRAANQYRKHGEGRRGWSHLDGESLPRVPGRATCVDCHESGAAATMMMNARGPCCEDCSFAVDTEIADLQTGGWRLDPMVVCMVVAAGVSVGALWLGHGIARGPELLVLLALLVAPVIGPMFLFTGLANRRLLHNLAASEGPDGASLSLASRAVPALTALTGAALVTASGGIWLLILVQSFLR